MPRGPSNPRSPRPGSRNRRGGTAGSPRSCGGRTSPPEARRLGPETPYAAATSGGRIPIPLVRARMISLSATSCSSSSTASRTLSIASRVSARKPGRQVLDDFAGAGAGPVSGLHPADPVEVGVEPAAGHPLEEIEHPLPLPEGEEERRGGAQLEGIGGHEDEMGRDARHLGEDQPDELGPLRDLDAEQLLGGHDERDLVGIPGHPVDAVDQGGDLRVGPDLGQLFVAAMHVPDHPAGRRRRARRRPGPRAGVLHGSRDAGARC